MDRGQTGLEYLLMIAGGVLLSAVVMAVANNNLNVVGDSINSSDYSSRIQTYLSTGAGANDGDWVIVGDDQFSGVPGNVGIGATSPDAKLDVNGDVVIRGNTTVLGVSTFNATMDLSNHSITGLAAPIDANDAANKEYVDAASSVGTYSACYVINRAITGYSCAAGYTTLVTVDSNGGIKFDSTIPASVNGAFVSTLGGSMLQVSVGRWGSYPTLNATDTGWIASHTNNYGTCGAMTGGTSCPAHCSGFNIIINGVAYQSAPIAILSGPSGIGGPAWLCPYSFALCCK